MAEIVQYSPLPQVFCVGTMHQQRNGYGFISSTVEHTNPMNATETITILRPKRHQERFFRIINDRPYVLEHRSLWKNTLVRKGSGRVNRQAHWRNTGEALRYDGVDYPIINFSSTSTILPAIPLNAFIPIRDANANRPAVAQVPQEVAPANTIVKTYPINTIPQHAIRALLRDAAMQEEVCPITGDEIDITNGAVTTCFHLFDKDAIATWILMPNSRDKCPVCNTQCKVYLLDDDPPGLDLSQ